MYEAEHTNPPGKRVDLDAELVQLPKVLRKLGRDNRTQLHDRVVGPALTSACTGDQALLVEDQIGRVEEEDLPDLCIERVDAQRCNGRSL